MARLVPQTFYLKHRDTLPVLEVALKDPDDTAHNLTGALSATLHIKLEDGTAVPGKAMAFDSDRLTGIVRYIWQALDWAPSGELVAGVHTMEYEILGPADARMTFPNDDEDNLAIRVDLGQKT